MKVKNLICLKLWCSFCFWILLLTEVFFSIRLFGIGLFSSSSTEASQFFPLSESFFLLIYSSQRTTDGAFSDLIEMRLVSFSFYIPLSEMAHQLLRQQLIFASSARDEKIVLSNYLRQK